MRVVLVEIEKRPAFTEIADIPECWEVIAGPGWIGCVQDGQDAFNFIATELAEYLGWVDAPDILCGDVIFAGEEWADVPDFVVQAARRYTEVTG